MKARAMQKEAAQAAMQTVLVIMSLVYTHGLQAKHGLQASQRLLPCQRQLLGFHLQLLMAWQSAVAASQLPA